MTFKITGSVRKTLEKNAGKTRSGGDFVSREMVVTVPNGDYMDDISLRPTPLSDLTTTCRYDKGMRTP